MTNDTIMAYYDETVEQARGVNIACKVIAIRLNSKWTWGHIKSVMLGWANPSKELITALERLAQPPTPRFRWKVEALDKEQMLFWMTLSMEEARLALDRAVRIKKNSKISITINKE